jgi:hypothetical protein
MVEIPHDHGIGHQLGVPPATVVPEIGHEPYHLNKKLVKRTNFSWDELFVGVSITWAVGWPPRMRE